MTQTQQEKDKTMPPVTRDVITDHGTKPGYGVPPEEDDVITDQGIKPGYGVPPETDE